MRHRLENRLLHPLRADTSTSSLFQHYQQCSAKPSSVPPSPPSRRLHLAKRLPSSLCGMRPPTLPQTPRDHHRPRSLASSLQERRLILSVSYHVPKSSRILQMEGKLTCSERLPTTALCALCAKTSKGLVGQPKSIKLQRNGTSCVPPPLHILSYT